MDTSNVKSRIIMFPRSLKLSRKELMEVALQLSAPTIADLGHTLSRSGILHFMIRHIDSFVESCVFRTIVRLLASRAPKVNLTLIQ